MPFTIRRRATAALAPLAAAALVALPSAATGAPSPCNGPLETDPTGDQLFSPTGLGADDPAATKTADNTDITGVFMDDSAGTVTANIQIANLTQDVPSPVESQAGLWYYVFFRTGDGTVHFVRAANFGGGDIEYAYGSIELISAGPQGLFSVYNTEGDTTGKFFEGANGVVQIVVPAATGAKPGTTVGGVSATADYIQGYDDFVGLNNHVDTAPDGLDVSDPSGASYAVAECPSASPVVPIAAAPIAVAPAQSSAPASNPAPASASAALPFRAAAKLGSARRARKGHKLRISVRSTQEITNLRVQLRRANGSSAVLGGGSLATLHGRRTMTLRLARTLRAGRYTLIAVGTVGGRTLRMTQVVRLTR